MEHVRHLTRLLELELELVARKRRITAAKSPTARRLGSIDVGAIPRLTRMQVQELTRCDLLSTGRRPSLIAGRPALESSGIDRWPGLIPRKRQG